ncbi:MAG: AMP-binding protein, partial [Candidatus Binataceae bacterium]
DQVRRMSTALRAMKLPNGSRIAISGRNTAHWFMADLAIAMSGHVSVGLYPKQAVDAVRYILKHSEAKAIFVGPADDIVSFRKAIPESCRQITFPYPDIAPGDYAWNDLVSEYEPQQDVPPLDPDAMFTIVYTSGTTGAPKGVVLSAANLAFAINGALEVLHADGNDRLFSYLPLAHIFERAVIEMSSLYANIPVSFLEDLRKFPVQLPMVAPTIFVAVPAVWMRLQLGILEKLPQKRLDRLLSIPIISGMIRRKILTRLGLQNVRFAVSGSAPIPESTLFWWDQLGLAIHQGYSMSENCAYAFLNQPGRNRFGSVGQLLPGSEVKFAKNGEILTRSPANMKGYYLDAEKTAETLDREGWLHTGDKGHLDDEGNLFITGRVKEIFKTIKGKYVAPAPIEGKFGKNADIESMCLVGAGLSQPVLLVSPAPGAREKDQEEVSLGLKYTLVETNATLEPHECVDHICVVRESWTIDNGLLTPTMKVQRSQVEKKYQDLVEKAVAGREAVVWE